ncbi:MAG: hypothetical protein ACI3XM_11215 [Eubacteriales bacterium]
MIQTECYLRDITAALLDAFGERLAYVGLQGSYLRGEASACSDIDIMVLIRTLTADDLALYRETIRHLDDADKSCGFICGTEEFRFWNPLEICHVLHSTKDYYGTLTDFIPSYTEEDHKKYTLLALGNLYHALCHRYVHADPDKNKRKLHTHAKEFFFLLQDLYQIRTGVFAQNRAELLEMMTAEDRIVYRLITETAQGEYAYDPAFSALLAWCQNTMREINGKD